MKREKKNMFEKRFEFSLNLLLSNGGRKIDVGKLHYRGATARRLYDRLQTTLDLMGIKYESPKNTMLLRVPTDEQIKSEQEWLNSLGTVSGRQIPRPQLFAQLQTGYDYTKKAQKIQSDLSAVSTMQGKRIHRVVLDDTALDDHMDALRNTYMQQMLQAAECNYGSLLQNIIDNRAKEIDIVEFAREIRKSHP